MTALLALMFAPTVTAVIYNYTCTYTTFPGTTLTGGNRAGSGVVTAGLPACGQVCCQDSGCDAATFVTSFGGCYLKGPLSTQTQGPSTSSDMIQIATRTPCTSGCDTNKHGDCYRGVAYGFNNQADLNALNPKWWYNWATAPDIQDPTREYVPMVWNWGTSSSEAQVITSIKTNAPGAKYLLGFNEPNFYAQANMDAATAASYWPHVENIAANLSLQVIGPAVNYCGGGCNDVNPYSYLDNFFAACNGCLNRMHAIAVHWYGACNVDYLTSYIGGYKKYNKTIWLTEFSCTSATAYSDQDTFLKAALDFLDNEPSIERYSWFSGRTTAVNYANLLDPNAGVLTQPGTSYTTYNMRGYCNAPTQAPTQSKSPTTSRSPTTSPTTSRSPTTSPTTSRSPTTSPTTSKTPTASPTTSKTPTASPTNSKTPTASPTASKSPTASPTTSKSPTASPNTSKSPTTSPNTSKTPTASPTTTPLSKAPTKQPTAGGGGIILYTYIPTPGPTRAPTTPTTALPTLSPSTPTTNAPSQSATNPNNNNTHAPTKGPTLSPGPKVGGSAGLVMNLPLLLALAIFAALL